MQRRIEQANRHRKTSHLAKDADKVTALEWQKFLQSFFTRADAVRENHLAHCLQSLIAKEHVLSAAKADALGAKAPRCLCIQRRVRIGPYSQPTKLVGPRHELVEIRA